MIYTDDRTLELYRSLPDEDRREFPFDAEQIDWKHYLQEVHCPAITVAMRFPAPRRPSPEVTVRGYRDVPRPADFDVVVVGPGPGDPNAVSDPKIAALRGLTTGLLVDGVPVLSICLGHQVLAALLGLPVRRRPQPAQGEQRTIDLFGWTEQVSFYNTFAAYAGVDRLWTPAGPVELCRERDTGEVYAIRAPRIRGVQFHPESVLTRRGTAILHELLTSVLDVPAGGPVPARSGTARTATASPW